MSDPTEESRLLKDLLDRVRADRAAGTARDVEAYVDSLPPTVSDRDFVRRRVAETLAPPGSESEATELIDATARAGEATEPRFEPATQPEIRHGVSPEGVEGRSIGGYEIVRELGRGGMGVVYLARDTALRRNVALKVLASHIVHGEIAQARFRREAETASRLDHPNLCGVLGVGTEEGISWIAMRHVPGRTLAELLREGGAVPLGDWHASVGLIETLARALHAAHEAGIVHRDLKPGNVMITDEGTPVVLDFGLAQDLSDENADLTQSGDVLGTPYYMTPEQIRGEAHRADRRLDVWALGVILYQLLTGKRPFEAASRDALYRSILEDDPSPVRRTDRRLPRDLEVCVATALAKEPRHRYESALALAEDLRAILDIQPIKARPPGPWARTAKFARRRPALALLLVVLVVGGPLVSYLATRQVLTRTRVEAAVAGGLEDARAAIERRDPRRARRLLRDVRALAPEDSVAREIAAQCDHVEALERVETLALDDEADPDGRRTLEEIAALRNSGDDASWLAVLEVFVRARIGDDAGAVERARDHAAENPGILGRLLVAAAGGAELPVVEDAAAEVVLARALFHSAANEHREALHLLTRLLERAPGAHQLAWAAAEQCTRMQSHQAALGFAGRARASTEAFGPRRLARYGVHLRRAGLVDEALRTNRAAATEAPQDPFVRLHLANTLAAAGLRDEAAAAFDALLADDPGLAVAWRGQGALWWDEKRWDDAATCFRKALELRPKDPDTLLDLANALVELKRLDDAEARIEEALALRRDFPFALNTLATIRRQQGRLEEARAAIDEVLRLTPNYPEGISNLGSILHAQGKIEEAEKTYRQALAMKTTHPGTLFNLALLLHTRRPKEAIPIYLQVIERDPEDAAALTNLANLLTNEGRAEEAIPYARRACEANPSDVVNWNNLATSQSESGKIDEAIVTLRKAVSVDITRIEPHANLMLLLEPKDPLGALAHGILLVGHAPAFANKAGLNLIRLRAALKDSELDHPLLDAEALRADRDAEDEKAFYDCVAAARGLPEGDAGSRPWALRRATLLVLSRVGRRLRLREDAKALRAEALAPPARR